MLYILAIEVSVFRSSFGERAFRRSGSRASAEFSTRRWPFITRFLCEIGGCPTMVISERQMTRLDALEKSK